MRSHQGIQRAVRYSNYRYVLHMLFCLLIPALSLVQTYAQDRGAGDTDAIIPSTGDPIADRHNRRIDEQLRNLTPQQLRIFHEADSLVASGQAPTERAAYDTAVLLYFDALRIYEDLQIQPRIATTLTDLGNVYLRMDNGAEAGKYYERALELYKQLQDSIGIQIGLTDMGVYYQRLDNFEEAIRIFQQSLPMARRFGNRSEEAIILGNLGSTYREFKEFDKSLEYLKQALEIKRTLNAGRSIAHSLNDIAETYFYQGNFAETIHYAREAIDYSSKNGYRDQEMFAYSTLSKAQERIGSYHEALASLYAMISLRDSITNEQTNQTISDLRVKYETSEKERALAALSAENDRTRARNRIYLFLALIAAIIGVSVFYVQRLRRKRDHLLLEQSRELERMRSNFFANISHEFRTPLTLILGPVHKLRELIAGSQTNAQLTTIERNAKRLLFLINQVLDLARIEINVLTMRVSAIRLGELLADVTSSFDGLAQEKAISLTSRCDVPDGLLYGDYQRLESVLINLLSNAFKFTPREGRISVKAYLETSGTIRIEVTDSGPGIPAEEQERIFERYYSDDKRNTLQQSGIGIGLSLCKSLVELHDGKIIVTSQPGHGATFSLELPVGKQHFQHRKDVVFAQDDIMVSDGLDSMEDKGGAQANNGTEASADAPLVLIVEDRTDMRAFLKETLRSDYRILEAENGKLGFDIAKEEIPDLIVSDIMMPVMDGIEFCKKIRTYPGTSHIPVVLLTAKSSDQDRLEGLESEANAYLSKPFIPQELLVSLRNLHAWRIRQQSHFARQSILKPEEIKVESTEQKFFDQLSQVLESEHGKPEFSVDEFAAKLHMSRTQLHRKLKALTGNSASDVIRSYRLKRAYDLLHGNAGSVSEISYQVGFNSPSYFIKCFREEFGTTPGEARETSATGLTQDL